MKLKLLACTIALTLSLAADAQICLIDDFTLSGTEGAYGIYADIDCTT